ncbi:MAG: hypothetical protein FWD77_11810 [Betaproteobacteria bacterium]|nr:hypothetical protein [Betaproteobacteria bacterium]
MLSLTDCLDLCDLRKEEIEAIAEHEHIPLIVAAELGCELIKTQIGVNAVEDMMLENIHHAEETGHSQHAEQLNVVYQRFYEEHHE